VVHEPAQDSQVHHLEELQVAHSENISPLVTCLFHWTSRLHVAGSHDNENAQSVACDVSFGDETAWQWF